MVRVKQSVRCVCVSLYLKTTFELINDFWHRYLACWFILTLSGPVTNVNVIDQIKLQGHRMKNVAKVVGALSSEGFLPTCIVRLLCTFNAMTIGYVTP